MIIEMTDILKYFSLHLDHLNKRGDNIFDQKGSLFNSLAFFSYNVNDSTLLLKVCAKILFQEEIRYTVEPRYVPAKVTVKCMGQNADISHFGVA